MVGSLLVWALYLLPMLGFVLLAAWDRLNPRLTTDSSTDYLLSLGIITMLCVLPLLIAAVGAVIKTGSTGLLAAVAISLALVLLLVILDGLYWIGGLGYAVLVVGWWQANRALVSKKACEPSCRICGYLLYGLLDARCPECGTKFDPELLRNGTGAGGLTHPSCTHMNR